MAEQKKSVKATVRSIRRATRKKYTAEEKVRIVLEGLRGESTIAELCRNDLGSGKCLLANDRFYPKCSEDVHPLRAAFHC
jgi:hypothetical protein